MSRNYKFYSVDSVNIVSNDLADKYSERFPNVECRFIDRSEAEGIFPFDLFKSLTIFENRKEYYALPIVSTGRVNVYIPHDISEHDIFFIQEKSIEDTVSYFFNKILSDTTYIFSTNPDLFLAVEVKSLSYDTFYYLQSFGIENTQLIVFDASFSNFIIVDIGMKMMILSVDQIKSGDLSDWLDLERHKSYFCNYIQSNDTSEVRFIAENYIHELK